MELGEFHKKNQGFALDGTAVRAGGDLIFTYALGGPLDRIAWPARSAAPKHRDGLWEHTCFEAFVGQTGRETYGEWNFSPSGDWAGYAFRSYRESNLSSRAFAPAAIHLARGENALTLTAAIPFRDVATLLTDETRKLRIGLTAVLELTSGEKLYWALRHAAAKPDFHQAASFILELP